METNSQYHHTQEVLAIADNKRRIEALEKKEVRSPILSDLHKAQTSFLMAKYDANQPESPFLIGGEPSNMRSGVVESTSTFSEVFDRDESQTVPIGTRDYVVIGYCPSLSVYFG
jgi:hypothetical protein